MAWGFHNTITPGQVAGALAAQPAPFSVTAYLKQNPGILNNYISGDPAPNGQTYENVYGSLAKYAIADAQANGSPADKQAIAANSLAADSAQADAQLLPALGYTQQGGTDANGVPLEQAFLNAALPEITNQITGDAARQKTADQLAASALAGAAAANTQLSRTQGGHFDGNTYFQQNPDVASSFNSLQNGPTPGTKIVNGQPMTQDQFAEYHYLNYGQQEGRKPAYVQSAQLAQDFNNADKTTAANIAANNTALKTQLGALTDATTAMQGNLQGDLAAKAAALQTQIASLNQNLDQLDASQKAALAQQIATQQQDLEQSIATQRQALQDQIAALGTAATADAAAKRASLEQEIQGLTAAQAPLNAARVAAAQMQVTAINAGLQSTQDQLTAKNALAGYVGGSSGQDAALARSAIDARQNAAIALGSANTANATDTRDIGVQGATGARTIADALAEAQMAIASQAAGGNAGLTVAGAQGKQQLGDLGATGLASITGNTAASRAGIGALGANTTYSNVAGGADAAKAIADARAQGTYGLTSGTAQNNLLTTQQGNAAKATYYDSDYARSLAAAVAPTTIAGNLVSTLNGLNNYSTSGLTNAQGLLNWWSTNQAPPPTTGAIAVTPSTAGNSISNLGTGLVNAGVSVGNANNWWKTPTTTGTYSVANNIP